MQISYSRIILFFAHSMNFFGETETKPEPARVRKADRQMTSSSPAWDAVVNTVDAATSSVKEAFTVAEDATVQPTGWLGNRLSSLWYEATSFVEEAKNTVGDKIAEMTLPGQIDGDALSPLRNEVTGFVEILNSLKQETIAFVGLVDTLRSQSGPLYEQGDGIDAKLTDFNDPLVHRHWVAYKEAQVSYSSSPQLAGIRSNLEALINSINSDVEKLSGVLVRFRRRDKLFSQGKDLRAKINKRKTQQRKLGQPDEIISQELYEMTTEVEDIMKEFATTTDTIVAKANELLTEKSKTVQNVIIQLLDLQKQTFTETATFSVAMGSLLDRFNLQPASSRDAFTAPTEAKHPIDLTRSPTYSIASSDAGDAPNNTSKGPYLARSVE